MRIAVGDTHGCYKSLRKLLEEEIGIGKTDEVYLLGDYIDRGPLSKQVLDYLMQLQQDGYQVFPLRGNHEEMLENAYQDQASNNFMLWMMNGAETTFQSFGIESYPMKGEASMNDLPETYLSFIRQMPYYYMLDDFILVHAGIDFSIDRPFEDVRSMVWCRDCENDLQASGNRVIIHGHTPIPLSSIQSDIKKGGSKEINLDAGCVYKGRLGMGNLVAMDMQTMELYITENVDF